MAGAIWDDDDDLVRRAKRVHFYTTVFTVSGLCIPHGTERSRSFNWMEGWAGTGWTEPNQRGKDSRKPFDRYSIKVVPGVAAYIANFA